MPAPSRNVGAALDSAQKGSYALGLRLPGPARLMLESGPEIPQHRFDGLFERAFSGMSTFMASADTAAAGSRWHIIDAEGQVLGRLATLARAVAPGQEQADLHAVHRHRRSRRRRQRGEGEADRPQGRSEDLPPAQRLRRRPARRARPPGARAQARKLVEDAVHGMLPKTKMGEAMYRKLKVYAGPDHPHAAQKPSKLEVA